MNTTAKDEFEKFFNSFPRYGTHLAEDWKKEIIKIAESYAKKKVIQHIQAMKETIIDAGLDGISSWDGNLFTGEGSDHIDRDKIYAIYPEKLISKNK